MVKVNKEVEEFYSEEPKENKVEWVNIPSISIQKGSFGTYVDGAKKDLGKSFKARPIALYTKFQRAGTKADNFAPVAETVMVRSGDKVPYYDTLGTESLGRVVGAKDKATQENNKKLGTFYAVLFAVVDGTLYHLKVPNAKAFALVEFYRNLESKYPFTNEIEVKINDDEYLVVATTKIDQDSTPEIESSIHTVKEYVQQHNMKIMKQYNTKSGKSPTPDYSQENVDLDDEIPF